MKTLYFKLFVLIIGAISISSLLQAQIAPISSPGGITISNNPGGTGNRVALAYNPTLQLYYSNNGGTSGYPLQTFNASGNLVADVPSSYDPRGLWWNPALNQLEGNGYNTAGVHQIVLDGNGYATSSSNVIFAGQNQPYTQSVGDLDYDANEIIYYYQDSIYRYDRATGSHVGTYALNNIPSGGTINPWVVMYSGVAGHEILIYDYSLRKVYAFDKANGNFAAACQLPNTAPQPSIVKTTYANNLFWLYDDTQWISYDILCQGSLTVTETVTNVTCNGGSEGSIFVSISGGVGPYQVVGGNQYTTDTFTIASGLTAGTYSYQIVDANLFCGLVDVTITEPTPISLVVATNATYNVSCNGGSNGIIAMVTSGGTGTYYYDYSHIWSNGQTSDTLFNLTAGTYTVTATDLNGCTATESHTITEPTAITFSAVQSACSNGTDGTITVTATGGTAPYQYSKNNGVTYQASNVFTGLAVGNHDIVVKDAKNCTTAAQNVSVQSCFSIDTTIATNVSCNGGSNGSVQVTVAGGTAPYSDGTNSYNTNPFTITGLSAGAYAYTITEANGAMASISGTLTQPTAVIASIVIDSNATCNGFADGGLTASATGGTGNHTYLWSNAATTASITGIMAGSYTVTVTDVSGCTNTATATVTEPTAVALSLDNAIDVSCPGGGDGVLDVSTTGGLSVAAVYISEVNPDSPDFIEITSNGTIDVTGYQVVVSDDYSDITIANPLTWTLSGTMTANTPVYREDVNGANYWGNNLFWNPGNKSWAIIIDPAGNIVDAIFWGWTAADIANFSITVGGTTVTNNGAWTGNGVNASCNNSFTRTGTTDTNTDADWTCITQTKGVDNLVIPAAVTGSYTYNWSNGQTTDSIVGLTAGSYTVTVTDANGCTATGTYTVGTTPDTTAPTVVTQNITLQLNASGNATTTAAIINNGSTDNCTAAGALTLALSKTAFTCADLGTNTVTLTVTDASGNSSTGTATVTVQDNIAPVMVTQNITVALDAAGTATITTAQIDNGTTDNCTTNPTLSLDITSFDCADLGANTVTLTATDAQGNTATETAIVTVIDDIAPIITANGLTIDLDEDGFASITVADINDVTTDNCDGNPTFSLDISEFDCSNLGNNAVTLTATDASGNSSTKTVNVKVRDVIKPTLTCKDYTWSFDETGVLTLTPEDLIQSASDNCDYTATISQSVFTENHLGRNTVTVTVTDDAGNSVSCEATVRVNLDCMPVNAIITPNNDGKNDIWIADCLYTLDAELTVFNRFGQLVYKEDSFDGQWDGLTADGQDLPQGAYFYVIKAQTGGNENIIKGNITILRK